MKKRIQKRPPIKIVSAFGPITRETIEALPEHVRRRLAALIYGFFAEREAEQQDAMKMAA